MKWTFPLSIGLLFILSACSKTVDLYQSLDRPSTTTIEVNSSHITLNGKFLDRVKKIRLTGENTDMILNIDHKSSEQIQATPPNFLEFALGKTYSFLITSAEADTTSNVTFVINPGDITPDLLDRAYMPVTGGAFTGDVSVSTQLSTTGTFSATTATLGVTQIVPGSSGTALTVGQANGIKGNILINGTMGTCTLGDGTSGTNCTSDQRLKKNITEISDALQKLKTLRGVYYQWKNSVHRDSHQHIGVIAQEVEKKFPELVSDIKIENETYRSVDYAGLVAPLIQAVKELDAQIIELRTQVQEQQKVSQALREELKKLNHTKSSSR